MSRTATGLCLASVFALVASAGAQQTSPSAPARNDGTTPTTADTEQTASSRAGGSDAITLTGCLDRSPNGTYVLNRARVTALGAVTPGSAPGSASTTGSDSAVNSNATPGSGASTTAGSGPAGTVSGSSTADISDRSPTSTWALRSTSDLAPHVGHQIQVTGHAAAIPGGSAAAGATTPGASGTTGATGTSGTSSSTSEATGTAGTTSAAAPSNSVDVQSVRMIANSCP